MDPDEVGDLSDLTPADASLVLEIAQGSVVADERTLFAADVTGNGTVSALDAQLILERITGSLAAFPVEQACGTRWFAFPEPSQTVSGQTVVSPQVNVSTPSCLQGEIRYTNLSQSLIGQNFVLGLFGDVNASWGGGAPAATPTRTPTRTRTPTWTPSPTV